MVREEVRELAMQIRTGPHIGMSKLDPEGDLDDALTLAEALYGFLLDLGWTPPTQDAAATREP